MKSSVIVFICSLVVTSSLTAQEIKNEIDSVEVIRDFKNLYRYRNFYLGRQPTLEAIRWLRSQGVTKVINLRSEEEVRQYSEYAYNESKIAEDMGFEYVNIPVIPAKDYTPEKLELFARYMSDDEKILIHCTGAGRVTEFFMAYLIEKKGYTVDEAVTIGKDLKFSLPLEKLLGTEISMEESKQCDQ